MAISWILFDQAKVQTYDMFSQRPFYEINGKRFPGKELAQVFEGPDHKAYNVGRISETQIVDNFLARTKLDLSRDEFITLVRTTVEPIPGVGEIMRTLKGNGYHLAALINEGKEWAHYKLDATGYRPLFEHVLISGELGVSKPDIAFYELALKTIGAQAQECIFIDDKERNLRGSRELAIWSVLFTDAESLKKSLLEYNIKI